MTWAHTLFHREGFRRLFAAQAISSIGDWLATFALMTLVLDISGSAAAVGVVLALRFAPATVAGALIGFVATRWGRRVILVRLDLIRAGITLLIPIVSALWWVYSWALALEVATVIAVAARDASIRDLVDDSDLPVANGMVLAATYGAIPIGAGSFAAISAVVGALPGRLSTLGIQPAFWVDAVTFLASALLIRRVGEISARPDRSRVGGGRLRLRDSWGTAASLGIGTIFSLGVRFVRDTLGASEAQFGILVVAFGIGAAGGLALRQMGTVAGVRAVRLGVAVMGTVMVGMALTSRLPLALLLALLFGAGGALAIVSGLTVLQQELPSAARLIALGAFHVAVRVALAAGALAAGLVVDLMGATQLAGLDAVRFTLVASGAMVTASSLIVRAPQLSP
jgi:predicted MFS family arabinose efflux permease